MPLWVYETLKPLPKILAGLHRSNDLHGVNYDKLSGSPELRQQVTRLAICLAQEALSIALRTLTQPGDVVAVDSPSFYGTMQILKANGLKALEIPTDPRTGISLEALELALFQLTQCFDVATILSIHSYSY